MKKAINGFTLVELLVVIATIGILSTIGAVGFIRYQAGARDSERSSDVQAISQSLETYYLKNGEYPSCSALTTNASTVTSSILVGVDPSALKSPTASSDSANSITCASINSTPDDIFAYQGDQSSACSSGVACRSWTLSYHEEATGSIVTIASKHQDPLAAIGDLAVAATSSQINVTWGNVLNATNYDVQSSSSSTFASGSVTTTNVSTNTTSISDLSVGTLYYFRVMPKNATLQGNWSNVVSASLSLPTPTNLTLQVTSSTSIIANWTAPSGSVTGYNIQYSESSSFSSPSTFTIHSSSVTNLGLAQGQAYYFRVNATFDSGTSDWSNVATATTTLDAPTQPTVTTSTSGNTTTFSWAGTSCPADTTIQYRYRSYTSDSTAPSWSAVTSTTSLGLTTLNQGYTYVTDVQARCHTTGLNSSWTALASANYLRPVSTPGSVSYNIYRTNNSDNTRASLKVTATSTGCGPGTQIYSRMDAGMWGGLIVWDTGQKGWYSDSHSGTWANGSWNAWGDSTSPTYFSIQEYPTVYYTSGSSTWAIAVEQKCTNPTTGVSSASTGRLESPHMAFPSS